MALKDKMAKLSGGEIAAIVLGIILVIVLGYVYVMKQKQAFEQAPERDPSWAKSAVGLPYPL